MSSLLSSIRDNAYLAVRGFSTTATPVVVAVVLCFSGVFSSPLQATELTAEIGIGGLSGKSGFLGTNITTGTGNIQQNSGAFSVGDVESTAAISVGQASKPEPIIGVEQVLNAQIEAGAFDDSLGLVMVNQSSGIGNTQLNGAAIAKGEITVAFIELRDNALLEAVTVPNPGGTPVDDFSLTQTQTSLSPDAFTSSSGVIQINQVAGNLNATSNRFVMSVHQ